MAVGFWNYQSSGVFSGIFTGFLLLKTEHKVGLLLPYQQCFFLKKKGCETANIQNRWWRLFQTTLFCSYDPALLDDPFFLYPYQNIQRGSFFIFVWGFLRTWGFNKKWHPKGIQWQALVRVWCLKGSRFSEILAFSCIFFGPTETICNQSLPCNNLKCSSFC